MAGRVFPVMSYLRRIDKHPTGDCPWCGPGVTETLCHFQSECAQFQSNRMAAHNDIARATIAALKDLKLKGWTFLYETKIKDLPFQFAWSTEEERRQQQDRRPDGVAYNELEGTVVFLEFTRAMDNPENMLAAFEKKGQQYSTAMEALIRAQSRAATQHNPHIGSVTTAPLIFGVRGTVLMEEARASLQALKLSGKQLAKVLTCGVRAAITAASEICTARTAALRCLPKAPRGPDGRRVKVLIPQKPFRHLPWRSDRGAGGKCPSRGGGGR